MSAGGNLTECAILFGIPVDREEFDVAVAGQFDYMAGFRIGDPAAAWRDRYSSTAAAAQYLIRTAEDLGVTVYRAARLNDFASATALFGTVIVFAHWRGAIFRATDFHAPLDAVLARLEDAPRGSSRQGLVEWLNGLTSGLELLGGLPPSVVAAAARSAALRQTLCRDVLDERLAGAAAPGNRIELFDGLHSMANVESALAPGFTGTLDLALCRSEAFSVYLDLRGRKGMRRLFWSEQLLPIPQLLKVECALRMAADGISYADARLRIEEDELSTGGVNCKSKRF